MCEKLQKDTLKLGQRVVTGFGNREVIGDLVAMILNIFPVKIRHIL